MINIILCGGNGTRLWPISRTLLPKQFVKIFNNRSLFQQTVLRNSKICTTQMIVFNKDQYFLALDQLEELTENQLPPPFIQQSRYLLEPQGRNTAPAITLACLDLAPDEIVLVTPSDHLIKNEIAYQKYVSRAKELAEQNFLVTFGIQPNEPETGFGYIEADGEKVLHFKEKPDLETAKQYIKKGNYLWNSGMFCFKAGVFLSELEKYSPEIYQSCQTAFQEAVHNNMIRIKLKDMVKIPEDSIDYAVMEKSQIARVIPTDMQWNDVGSFDSLAKEFKEEAPLESLIPIDSQDNFILSSKLVATIGVEDLIIIDTPDALLVSKKGLSQKVKEVVTLLKKRKTELTDFHVTTHRPWGSYTILEESPGYKIKKIIVKPGKRLSLQKHFHRNEHWIVVSGTALVTLGESEFLVRTNESTFIKMGEIHRLANPGKIPLVLLEAQVGEYTGENDIVRVEDDFHRIE